MTAQEDPTRTAALEMNKDAAGETRLVVEVRDAATGHVLFTGQPIKDSHEFIELTAAVDKPARLVCDVSALFASLAVRGEQQ